MEDYFDVVVVGAGPAGASAAQTLSSSGFKTLLIEKEYLPRRKTCAGFIPAAGWDFALERFGQPDPGILAEPERISGVHLSFSGGVSTRVDFPLPGYSVNRAEFDRWLATRCGARLRDGVEVTELKLERFHVYLTLNDGADQVEATHLVAADGATSPLLSVIRPEFYRTRAKPYHRPVMVLQMQADLDWDPHYLGLVVLRELAAVGRFWVKNGLLSLAVRYTHGRGWEGDMDVMRRHLRQYYGLAHETMESRFPASQNLMCTQDSYNFGAGTALLAGEGSGLINGWGEGIYAALRSGEIAGRALVDSAGERVTPHLFYQSRVAPYAEELRREFTRSHHLVGGIDMRRLFPEMNSLQRRRRLALLYRKLRG